MFIGHYAIGLAAVSKKQTPSLALSFVAVQLLDLLWPLFVLTGVETFRIDMGNTKLTPIDFNSYPFSHSLLMAAVWGMALATVYGLVTKSKNASFVIFLLVLSHWVLDFLTHKPDLPLSPFDNTKLGMGGWNYPLAVSIFEIGLFMAGALLYFRSVQPRRKIAYWLLIGVLLLTHLMNILGPPPPNEMVVAWSANAMWLFVLWAWWIEREKPASNTMIL